MFKIIEQDHEIMQGSALEVIEAAGRTCWKSEGRIERDENGNSTTAQKFFNGLRKRNHTAMFEFGTITLAGTDLHRIFYDGLYKLLSFPGIRTQSVKYMHCTKGCGDAYLTASIRTFMQLFTDAPESALARVIYPTLLAELPEVFGDFDVRAVHSHDLVGLHLLGLAYEDVTVIDPRTLDEEHRVVHEHVAVRFVTDRGVTHEMVRHRPCGFAQESTRYVNYKKGVEFIRPQWFDEKYVGWQHEMDTEDQRLELACAAAAGKLDSDYVTFLLNCRLTAYDYTNLLNNGRLPQEGRDVLSNALKTEICVVANLEQWNHMFDLRVRGTTGKPHPQIKALMYPAMIELNDLTDGVISKDMPEGA